jgi:hypothetical protein
MSGDTESDSRTAGARGIAAEAKQGVAAAEAAERAAKSAAKDGDFKAFDKAIGQMNKDQVGGFVKSQEGEEAIVNLTKNIKQTKLNVEQENAIAGIADKILASVPKPPSYIKKFVVACCDVLPQSLSKKFASFVDPWKEEIAKEEQNKQVREQATKVRSALVSRRNSHYGQQQSTGVLPGMTTTVGQRGMGSGRQ